MEVNQAKLDDIVRGLGTKSDKIRALGREGVPTAKIAQYLAIRYQHARNVLVDSGLHVPKAQDNLSDHVSLPTMMDKVDTQPEWVEVDAQGRIQLPIDLREAVGIKTGTSVHVRVEGDTIEILSQRTAIKRAQSIVRKFVPPGVSLVDELIAERRRETQEEEQKS